MSVAHVRYLTHLFQAFVLFVRGRYDSINFKRLFDMYVEFTILWHECTPHVSAACVAVARV